MTKDFKVKAGGFEGPVGLLLELIERRKLHISQISLAQVADDYIEHIKQFEEMPVADTANFILVASTLLLIKSLSLLPSLEVTEEEKASIEELERRLKIFQEIRAKSAHIKERFGKNIIFEREPSRNTVVVFSPPEGFSIQAVLAAIRNVIVNLPKKEFLPQAIVRKVISLEEMIGNLTERIKKNLKMKFSEFSNTSKNEKVTVIVSFLAMLELVKQGAILVRQHAQFSDIEMESSEPSTVPNYS